MKPINYNLHLEPDLSSFKFSGLLDLSIEAEVPTQKVVLNCLELVFKKIQVQFDNDFIDVDNYEIDLSKQELIVNLPDNNSKQFVLRFEYIGEHNDKLAGFYRSRFNVNGETKYAVVTQFQANDARRAFPCFDIPGIKATFDIEFVIDKDLFAISNMPIQKETEINGNKLVRFEQTPVMSTYLLFFGVGDFDFIEKTDKNRQYRVFTSPGKAQKHGHFALDFGIKVVNFCEKYFDFPYPLPKLDQIATPDFAAGAMENWGAILYRENALLYYEGTTSKAQENGILGVIAHEIVHQWFGNLVSPTTWKYLWLNESFATFFANVVVDNYFPEKRAFQYFVQSSNIANRSRSTTGVMDWDAMIETSPIEIDGDGAISFTAKTVPILYSKGGSILRQVEGYLGKTQFRDGLRAYFKKYAYGSTISNYLWESLEDTSGQPVTKIMQSFVLQKGLPVITIQRENSKLQISQERFTYLPYSSDQLWAIPITIRIFNNDSETEIKRFVLDKSQDSFDLGSFDAYKINIDLTGFYRTHYPNDDYALLGDLVRENKINAIDRMNIEDDLYALLKSKRVSLQQYLAFLQYYEYETSHMSLLNIPVHLRDIFDLLGDGEKKLDFKKYAREYVENIFKKISYDPVEDEDSGISIIRGTLLRIAVDFDSEIALEFSMKQFEKIKNDDKISADLRAAVLIIAAKHSNDFDWFMHRYENPISEAEFIMVIVAMCSFTDKEHLNKVQNMIFDKIPGRNRSYAIATLSSNPVIREDVWEWYLANLDSFESLNNFMFQGAVLSVIRNSDESKDDMISFFNEYVKKNPRISDAVEVGMEQLEIKLNFKSHLNS